jgi:MinD superfamily P-loop ATPase
MEIAVISGKGGTGKSLLSAALAVLHKQVVLADCDVDAANLHWLFDPVIEEEEAFPAGQKAVIGRDMCDDCGICMDACRFDAIALSNGHTVIDEVSCEGCALCTHLCPNSALKMEISQKSRIYSGAFKHGEMLYGWLAPGEENSGKMVSVIREKAKKRSENGNFDLIILDGPPGIGCPVISTITGTDLVVVVTEPSLSGLSDMRRALETTGRFGNKVGVVINKSTMNPTMSDHIRQWCRENDIPLLGTLPFDKEVVIALTQKKSIVDHAPDSEVSSSILDIYHRIHSL